MKFTGISFSDYLDKLLKHLLHPSIRDEAMGDFWELHYYRVSRSNLFLASAVSIVRFGSLVLYSLELTVEDCLTVLQQVLLAIVWVAHKVGLSVKRHPNTPSEALGKRL